MTGSTFLRARDESTVAGLPRRVGVRDALGSIGGPRPAHSAVRPHVVVVVAPCRPHRPRLARGARTAFRSGMRRASDCRSSRRNRFTAARPARCEVTRRVGAATGPVLPEWSARSRCRPRSSTACRAERRSHPARATRAPGNEISTTSERFSRVTRRKSTTTAHGTRPRPRPSEPASHACRLCRRAASEPRGRRTSTSDRDTISARGSRASSPLRSMHGFSVVRRPPRSARAKPSARRASCPESCGPPPAVRRREGCRRAATTMTRIASGCAGRPTTVCKGGASRACRQCRCLSRAPTGQGRRSSGRTPATGGRSRQGTEPLDEFGVPLTAKKSLTVDGREATGEVREGEYNGPNARRDAVLSSIACQSREGRSASDDGYDDVGESGCNPDCSALEGLPAEIEVDRIDIVVVYEIDSPTAACRVPPSRWSYPTATRRPASPSRSGSPTRFRWGTARPTSFVRCPFRARGHPRARPRRDRRRQSHEHVDAGHHRATTPSRSSRSSTSEQRPRAPTTSTVVPSTGRQRGRCASWPTRALPPGPG